MGDIHAGTDRFKRAHRMRSRWWRLSPRPMA